MNCRGFADRERLAALLDSEEAVRLGSKDIYVNRSFLLTIPTG
jgi:hypothetical protein